VPVEIDFAADRGAAARIAITDLAALTVWTSACTAVKVHRTAAQTHDDFTPSIFMGLQMTGSCVVVQHGREAILRPGDLVIYDSTSPFLISDVDGIRQHKFRIPLDRLALPADVIRRVCAVSLSPGHPITDLAATYLHRLALRPTVFDRPGGDLVSQPSIELLRAVITTHLDAVELGKESLHATCVNPTSAPAASPPSTTYRCASSTESWPTKAFRSETGSARGDSRNAAKTSPRRAQVIPSWWLPAGGGSPTPPVSRGCSGPRSACRRANGVRPTATDLTERRHARDCLAACQTSVRHAPDLGKVVRLVPTPT
jgi:hypothetical protein